MKPRTVTNRISTVLLLCGFFFTAAGYAFAEGTNESVTNGVTKIINYVIHVAYTYTNGGQQLASTNTVNKTTQTSATVAGKTTTSTTATTSVTQGAFLGGSVKDTHNDTTSTTTGSDNSKSVTTSKTDTTYNGNGQIQGASGSSTSTIDNGTDANGQKIGTATATGTDTYQIKNGSALLTRQTSSSISYGPDGKKTSTGSETTDYSYDLVGGAWHMMKEVNNSVSNMTNGGVQTMNTIKNYARNTVGLITGLTQTASGSLTQIGENGSKATFNMKNYSASSAKDDVMGYYIKNVSFDWVYAG